MGMIESVVVVYSPEWVINNALENLFTEKHDVRVIATNNISDLLSVISARTVSSVILHAPERDYIRLICCIRHQYPVLPVIIVQKQILFSDMAVARWFGNVWLKDFSSLMVKHKENIQIDSCVSDNRFAGNECAPACNKFCTGKPGSERVLKDTRKWLGLLLRERMGSRAGAKIVSEWLASGASVEKVSKQLGCSRKVINHYRRMAIKSLNILNNERDFLPSVSLRDSPLPGYLSGKCKVRDLENEY
ncbi:hypothetical protein LRN38_004362 [Salmonella enterica]|nr:hypothetical protein [Salmonella enterica]EIP0361197.1 hypothetical protein [Salmonella enterica]